MISFIMSRMLAASIMGGFAWFAWWIVGPAMIDGGTASQSEKQCCSGSKSRGHLIASRGCLGCHST